MASLRKDGITYAVYSLCGDINCVRDGIGNKSEAINHAKRTEDIEGCETCVVAHYPTEDVEEWNSSDGFVSRLLVKMRHGIKKFNNSYMGFDDISIREIHGDDYLFHEEYIVPREEVEDRMRSEIDNDNPVPDKVLYEYIKQNHDAVVDYIEMLMNEGEGFYLSYGVVYRSMLKGTHTLCIFGSEEDAEEVAEMLDHLEDIEDEEEYEFQGYMISQKLQETSSDCIEDIRYDGEPEIEEVDIVNYDHVPDISW